MVELVYQANVIKELESVISDHFGIYITDTEITKKGLKIYHEAADIENPSPITLSYAAAHEMIEEAYTRQNLKAQAIADITLKMSRNGGRTNLYKMPSGIMETLQSQVNNSLISWDQYVSRANGLTMSDIYGMPIEDLEKIKDIVGNGMPERSVLIIPEIMTERPLTSLDTIEEYDSGEFFVPETSFNVDGVDVVPGELLQMFEPIQPLRELINPLYPFIASETDPEQISDTTEIMNRLLSHEKDKRR